MPRRLWFSLVLILFTIASCAHQLATAPFEGADEGQHLAYVLHLAQTRTLPDRATAASNATRQTSGQPPLYYLLSALPVAIVAPALNADQLAALLRANENRWYSPPDRWNPTDNRNVYSALRSFAGMSSYDPLVSQLTLYTVRGVSWAFGIVGIIGAYAAARAIFRRRLWSLTAAALFAFTPQYVQMSAIVHNDIAAYALAACVVASSLWIVRDGASGRRLILLGVLIGLAGLAKINALAVVPGAAAAVGLALLAGGRVGIIRRTVGAALWVGIPAAAILALWVIWGASVYGDPLGTATHYRPGYFYDQPLDLGALPPLVPEVILSYWGKLGSAVYLDPLAYTALAIVAVLALGGVLLNWRDARGWLRTHWRIALVLALVVLASWGALAHWLRTIHFITGRLAYPAHSVFAIALTGGLALLARRIPIPGAARAIAVGAAAIFIGTATGASLVSLDVAYGRIDTRAVAPADLIPVQIEYAPSADAPPAIRLLGYRPPAAPLVTGTLARYMLCWETLETAPGKRAAFSLKVFSQAGEQIADRTSLIGMGRYPSSSWFRGDRVCDAVDLPITGTLTPGATYNVLVVLLDAETMAVDWMMRGADGEPIAIPLIGSVTIPPG